MDENDQALNFRSLSRREFLKLLGAAGTGLFAWPRLTWEFAELGDREALPNILIVVFDALSARHISLYGYQRKTMPNLERAAGKALVYYRHYASANFTTPGTASILTGVLPWTHRALNINGVLDDAFSRRSIFHLLEGYYSFAYSHNPYPHLMFNQFNPVIDRHMRISELCLGAHSLADRYLSSDYNTVYQAEELILRNPNSASSSFFLSRFDRLKIYYSGFSLRRAYGRVFPRGLPTSHITYFTLEEAIDWLQHQVGELPQPYLGYVHLLPPHDPYNTRAEFIDIFNDGWAPPAKLEHFFSEGHAPEYLTLQRRLYDEYIAYVDAEFGRLYDNLVEQGALENTYLVFTSDHGELFERGIWAHNNATLYEPLLHVPLLIWGPEIKARQDIHTPTSCVDVLPTLLGLAGQAAPEWIEGVRLPGFAQAPVDEQRSIYGLDAKENAMHAPLTKATLALIKGRYKLIHYWGYPGYEDVYELYDLEADPEELVNQYENLVEIATELRNEMAQKLARMDRP